MEEAPDQVIPQLLSFVNKRAAVLVEKSAIDTLSCGAQTYVVHKLLVGIVSRHVDRVQFKQTRLSTVFTCRRQCDGRKPTAV